MIGLDTNVLARYYVASDEALTRKQSELARDLIDSGQALFVAKTVLLELECIFRGHYEFKASQVCSVFEHLLGLSHLLIEDRVSFEATFAKAYSYAFPERLVAFHVRDNFDG